MIAVPFHFFTTIASALNWWRLLSVMACISLAGCGSGTVPVSGTATYDGQPLGYGTITLSTASEAGNDPRTVVLDIRNGQFESAGTDGLMPGSYKATVLVYKGEPPSVAAPAVEGVESSGGGGEPEIEGQWEGDTTVESGKPLAISIDKASLQPLTKRSSSY